MSVRGLPVPSPHPETFWIHFRGPAGCARTANHHWFHQQPPPSGHYWMGLIRNRKVKWIGNIALSLFCNSSACVHSGYSFKVLFYTEQFFIVWLLESRYSDTHSSIRVFHWPPNVNKFTFGRTFQVRHWTSRFFHEQGMTTVLEFCDVGISDWLYLLQALLSCDVVVIARKSQLCLHVICHGPIPFISWERLGDRNVGPRLSGVAYVNFVCWISQLDSIIHLAVQLLSQSIPLCWPQILHGSMAVVFHRSSYWGPTAQPPHGAAGLRSNSWTRWTHCP